MAQDKHIYIFDCDGSVLTRKPITPWQSSSSEKPNNPEQCRALLKSNVIETLKAIHLAGNKIGLFAVSPEKLRCISDLLRIGGVPEWEEPGKGLWEGKRGKEKVITGYGPRMVAHTLKPEKDAHAKLFSSTEIDSKIKYRHYYGEDMDVCSLCETERRQMKNPSTVTRVAPGSDAFLQEILKQQSRPDALAPNPTVTLPLRSSSLSTTILPSPSSRGSSATLVVPVAQFSSPSVIRGIVETPLNMEEIILFSLATVNAIVEKMIEARKSEAPSKTELVQIQNSTDLLGCVKWLDPDPSRVFEYTDINRSYLVVLEKARSILMSRGHKTEAEELSQLEDKLREHQDKHISVVITKWKYSAAHGQSISTSSTLVKDPVKKEISDLLKMLKEKTEYYSQARPQQPAPSAVTSSVTMSPAHY